MRALTQTQPVLTQTQITQSFDHRILNSSIHQVHHDEGVVQKHKGTSEKMLVACQIKVIGLDCTSSKRNLASYTLFER